ncbi:hypothetical protein V1979_38045, partial [Pseudomonas aeruginosa]
MAGIFDRIAGAFGADETELMVEPMALDDGMDDQQALMSSTTQVDDRRTPQRVREAVQEMLKYGLLEESHKPNLYRSALSNIEAVDRILEPLDLAMGVDEVRGLVFVTVR